MKTFNFSDLLLNTIKETVVLPLEEKQMQDGEESLFHNLSKEV